VERVGDDLGRPHQARLHVIDEEQVHCAKHQSAQAHGEPDLTQVLHEVTEAGGGIREQPQAGGVDPQDHGDGGPDGHQHNFALQVVADLDVFLVLVGGVVHLVVALRLEEEVTRLPARHGHEPGQQRGGHRVGEHQEVGTDETRRAEQVQRLVYAAVVIVAVVIPTLGMERLPETLHGWFLNGTTQ